MSKPEHRRNTVSRVNQKSQRTQEAQLEHHYGKRAVGVEFQVNSYTTGYQLQPAITSLVSSDFVVVWTSYGQDGSSYGIYGQRYSSAGATQGAEFRVNSYTSNNQENPAIASLPSSDFVVVWVSDGQDGNVYGIYGQRYSSLGVVQGAEFQVNSYTTGGQGGYPAVSALPSGDFVVVWQSDSQDGDSYGVYGQRYTNVGVAQGSEFQVNSYTTADQVSPAVSALVSSDFVVVWTSNGQDGSSWGIYGRRYSSTGIAQGSEFQVNSYTTSDQYFSAITSLASGDFVVVWMSNGQDGSSWGIYGQCYSSLGVVQGGEFQVNSFTTSYQSIPAIASLASDDCVVVWTSDGQDGNLDGIYGQRYLSTGVAQGGEFQVNTFTTGNQGSNNNLHSSAIATLTTGDFVVTWMSENQDGDSWGVYAKIFPSNTSLSTTSLTSSISSSLSSSLSSSISSGLTSGITPQPIPQPSPSPIQIPIPQSVPVNINPITTSLTNSGAQPLYSPEFFSSTSGVTSLTSTTNTGVVETPTDSNSIPVAVPIAIGASVLALLAGFGLWRAKQKRDKPTKKMDIEMVHHTQHEEAEGNYRKLPDSKIVNKGYGEITEPPSAYQPVPKKPQI